MHAGLCSVFLFQREILGVILGTGRYYEHGWLIILLYLTLYQWFYSPMYSDIEAKRLAECKLRSELMEDELLQWRQEVDAYQKHSMNKAEEMAQVYLGVHTCFGLHQRSS